MHITVTQAAVLVIVVLCASVCYALWL